MDNSKKKKNQQRDQLTKELQRLDKMKTDFLRLISHRVRTQFNGIAGITDFVKIYLSKDELKSTESLLDIFEFSTERLEKLLLAVGYKSHVKPGIYNLRYETVEVCDILWEVQKFSNANLLRKKISLNVDCQGLEKNLTNLGLLIYAISEVIKNSSEFSPGNSQIFVSAYEKNEYLIFETKDYGTGLSKRFLKYAFKPFSCKQRMGKSNGLSLCL